MYTGMALSNREWRHINQSHTAQVDKWSGNSLMLKRALVPYCNLQYTANVLPVSCVLQLTTGTSTPLESTALLYHTVIFLLE